jgi:hypothetical protein
VKNRIYKSRNVLVFYSYTNYPSKGKTQIGGAYEHNCEENIVQPKKEEKSGGWRKLLIEHHYFFLPRITLGSSNLGG